MHRMQQMAPDKQFFAADPEAVCAYMKAITLPNVRDSLALDRYHVSVPPDIARTRPRCDRPDGRARQVSGDAEQIAAVALAEDGATDVTTVVTVPAGVAGEGGHRISQRRGGRGRRFCGRRGPGVRVPHRMACAATGARSRPGAVVGVIHGPLAGSSGRSGRCSTCCSGPAASRGHPALRRRRRGHRLPHPPHSQDRTGAPGARHRRCPRRWRPTAIVPTSRTR